MTQHIIRNLQDLKGFAQDLADKIAGEIRVGDANLRNIICLTGDLGAGKTQFSRAFINSFGEQEITQEITVTSPTYNIVQIYELGNLKIQHFDLYRLENADELQDIGFDEAVEGDICLIEWPQIAADELKRLKNQIINLKIEVLEDESRRITIS